MSRGNGQPASAECNVGVVEEKSEADWTMVGKVFTVSVYDFVVGLAT